MFYEILDVLVIGSLTGIVVSILFEKSLFPINTSTILGVIGALISFLIFEMLSIDGNLFQVGLSTLTIILLLNIIGRTKIKASTSEPKPHIKNLKEVRRSK